MNLARDILGEEGQYMGSYAVGAIRLTGKKKQSTGLR